MATMLVQNGTLRMGETIVAGTAWGRVKAMFSDTGKRVRKAEPSTPVAVLGLDSVPEVGDTLKVVTGEKQARALVQKRKAQAEKKSTETVSLINLYDKISAGKLKELDVILKADVQGSIEPIKNSLKQLGSDKLQVRVIRSAIGNVSESDVMLAMASKGLIIGFSVGVEDGARQLAEAEGIDIRFYKIIYNLIDDIEKALKGLLEPTIIEVVHGRAEVRAVFKAAKKNRIAGCYINEGKVNRSSSVRVKRQDEVIAESEVISLRRFKDDVNEVAAGYECGIGLKDFNSFKEGDVLEFYHKEKSK
jgi:translation initiation factor IF-2